MSFDNLMKDLQLSKSQREKIIKIIEKYSQLLLNEETHRYTFEAEMEEVDYKFRDSQMYELALKYYGESGSNTKAINLFYKLYGDMPKYKY